MTAINIWERGTETTGKEHELDMLGKMDAGLLVYQRRGLDPTKKEPLPDVIKKIIRFHPEKVKFFRRGRQVEGDLRINPEKDIFRDIYNQVASSLLGEEEAENIEILKKHLLFFNTLNTPIDKFNGTDAVFYYVDSKGQKHFCTIDVTKNPAKEEGYRADVIMMGEPPNRKAEKKAYVRWVNEYAGEITSKLQHGSVLF